MNETILNDAEIQVLASLYKTNTENALSDRISLEEEGKRFWMFLEDWADESLYFYEMHLRFGLPENSPENVPRMMANNHGLSKWFLTKIRLRRSGIRFKLLMLVYVHGPRYYGFLMAGEAGQPKAHCDNLGG